MLKLLKNPSQNQNSFSINIFKKSLALKTILSLYMPTNSMNPFTLGKHTTFFLLDLRRNRHRHYEVKSKLNSVVATRRRQMSWIAS